MAQQFLWIETCLKLAGGLALVTAPRALARLLGLPSADDRFWPRLLGAVLIGLAGASLIESRSPGAGGLGLAGSIAINLAGAAMIGALLILRRAGNTRRGRLLLCLVAALLALLSLVEIAYAGRNAPYGSYEAYMAARRLINADMPYVGKQTAPSILGRLRWATRNWRGNRQFYQGV